MIASAAALQSHLSHHWSSLSLVGTIFALQLKRDDEKMKTKTITD
jgi:hypothetical protein